MKPAHRIEKPTREVDLLNIREQRIRCAIGEPGDPRVPSMEKLIKMLEDESVRSLSVEIDVNEF